jgi:hypothetical protein
VRLRVCYTPAPAGAGAGAGAGQPAHRPPAPEPLARSGVGGGAPAPLPAGAGRAGPARRAVRAPAGTPAGGESPGGAGAEAAGGGRAGAEAGAGARASDRAAGGAGSPHGDARGRGRGSVGDGAALEARLDHAGGMEETIGGAVRARGALAQAESLARLGSGLLGDPRRAAQACKFLREAWEHVAAAPAAERESERGVRVLLALVASGALDPDLSDRRGALQARPRAPPAPRPTPRPALRPAPAPRGA